MRAIVRLEKPPLANKTRNFGFTLIELLVVMSIIALLLSILMPALGRARHTAMVQKDATQIKSIHSGWITWAAGNDDRYPTPGYVNRVGDIRGRGKEDRELNTTDNVHSLAVMQNLYSAGLLVSDSEPSDNVYAMEAYDYDVIDSNEDIYWDEMLDVDLDDGGTGCNVSYASIPLIGDRKRKEWTSRGSADYAIMANRGPPFGQPIDISVTYDIHGGGRTWEGNVCWQDNHMSFEKTLHPLNSVYSTDDGYVSDNLFNIDCVTGFCHFWGGDSWLVLVSELSPAGDMYEYQLAPELEWDDE